MIITNGQTNRQTDQQNKHETQDR